MALFLHITNSAQLNWHFSPAQQWFVFLLQQGYLLEGLSLTDDVKSSPSLPRLPPDIRQQCCCCAHDVELLHLCRTTQCRQQPHVLFLEWSLIFRFRRRQHYCNLVILVWGGGNKSEFIGSGSEKQVIVGIG